MSETSDPGYNKGYFWLMIFTATQGFMTWGYSFTIFNTLQDYLSKIIFPGISPGDLSLIASITTIGAMFGSLVAGPVSNRIGRRKILIVGDIVNIIAIIMTLFSLYPVMLVGRLINGFVIGIDTVIDPLYIIEMAPKKIRGKAGALTISMYSGSIFLAFVIGFILPGINEPPNEVLWRVCMGLMLVFSLYRLIMFLFVFKWDTPIYLLMKNQE
jgi:MFS family permease